MLCCCCLPLLLLLLLFGCGLVAESTRRLYKVPTAHSDMVVLVPCCCAFAAAAAAGASGCWCVEFGMMTAGGT